MSLRKIFSFPNPVNEYASRIVASYVVLVCIVFLITQNHWILILLAYGFLARVLTGPTLSPIGLFATKTAPKLWGVKEVAGPPKRFAQLIGALFSVSALLLYWPFGYHSLALIVISALACAAGLEASVSFCLGCKLFNLLMKIGLIPQKVCLECSNISLKQNKLPA